MSLILTGHDLDYLSRRMNVDDRILDAAAIFVDEEEGAAS